MSIRPLKLPADFAPLGEMLVQSFQYPENQSWSVQADEMEMLVDAIKNFKRIWPVIRLIQYLSPPLGDLMQGYVWEEDGKIVGTTIVQRRGSTQTWIITTVAVLPDYRRRGIARKLVEAGIGLIRSRGGDKAFLNVIDGNLPAYELYSDLGFEHYTSSIEFEMTPKKYPERIPLPEGYVKSSLDRFDWQPQYDLEDRISPENTLKYEPVEEGRFRQPVLMRVMMPLIMLAQGTREVIFGFHELGGSQLVGLGKYTVPTRGRGLNILSVRIDPNHTELVRYVLSDLITEVMTHSPGLRVELTVPYWMKKVSLAAENFGFKRRLEYRKMGILL